MIFVRASTVEPEEVEWLLPEGLFPAGMISAVLGRPGVGKSTITTWLTARVTSRLAQTVIHSNQEDHLRGTFVPRLQAAGADMRRVFVPDEPIVLPDDLPILAKRVRQMRASLFIADAASQHLRPGMGDDQGIRKALTPLKALCEETGLAAVFVHHTKSKIVKSADPLENLLSPGLLRACRAVYIFGPNPSYQKDREDAPDGEVVADRVLVPVPGKVNVGNSKLGLGFTSELADVVMPGKVRPAKVFRLELVDDHAFYKANDVLAAGAVVADPEGTEDDDRSKTKRAIAAQWLSTTLMRAEDCKRLMTDLDEEAAEAGLKPATVRRAAGDVGVEKNREGFGKGSKVWWRLPDDHPARAQAARMKATLAAANGVDPGNQMDVDQVIAQIFADAEKKKDEDDGS